METEEEVDPQAVKESQDEMAKFYERMKTIESQGPIGSETEDDGGDGPEARTEGRSSASGAHRRKRRGGRGSRLRRLLVHQLLLTEKRGLPLTRLLCLRRTEAKSQVQGRREQEESASPILKRRRTEVIEEETKIEMKETGGREEGEDIRKDVRSGSKRALSGDTTLLTPRITQAATTTHPSQVYPQSPGTPPFPNLTHPHTPPYAPTNTLSYTLPLTPPYTPPYTPAYTLPITSPNIPLFTPQHMSLPVYHTPPYAPSLCGPMPGPQWLFCGGCQAWGIVSPTT